MKTRFSSRRCCRGQVLAEACIGLSLVTFAWIMITYSLFMANNHIRTEMAARHAAWYKGTTGNDMTPAQLDQMFFYQSNVAKVVYSQGEGIGSVIGLGGNGPSFLDEPGFPTKATVTFGPIDAAHATQFPFDLLNTQVPLMPNSMLTNCLSVSASSQWDHVGETWNTPGAALSAVFNSLKGIVSKFF
jgi:hypothetical protein